MLCHDIGPTLVRNHLDAHLMNAGSAVPRCSSSELESLPGPTPKGQNPIIEFMYVHILHYNQLHMDTNVNNHNNLIEWSVSHDLKIKENHEKIYL